MKKIDGHHEQDEPQDCRTPYESPTIIYTGKISTRAGSPVAIPDGSTSVVDPADLFGDD